MKIHNCEQQTPAWFEIKKGKMSASHAQAIGTNGAGLKTYIHELMAEYYSTAEREGHNNEHMDRGNELEPLARSMYEMENDVKVEEVGFVECSKFTGFSPDGFIGKDGGIEIKCLMDRKHLETILYGLKAVDKKHIWQIQMTLLLSGRKWWDLVIYNPNFQKSLLVFRITPDEEMQDKIKQGLKAGELLIKKIKKNVG